MTKELAKLFSIFRQKLESLESAQNGFSGALKGVEAQIQAQTESQAPQLSISMEEQLDKVLCVLNTISPSTQVLQQALEFMKNAQNRVDTGEMATQTSPTLLPPQLVTDPGQRSSIPAKAPLYLAGPSKQGPSVLSESVVAKNSVKIPVSASTHKGSAAPFFRPVEKAAPPVFAALRVQGDSAQHHKRPREDDDSDDEIELSSRLARRVQRHRRMKGQPVREK